MYSKKVMDYFVNPRNIGIIKNADAVGEIRNCVYGDLICIYIKVKGEIIEKISFQAFGCGVTIATSSMITELAKGKTLDEAMSITKEEIVKAFGGLPSIKMYCINLAVEGLHKAIKNYWAKL